METGGAEQNSSVCRIMKVHILISIYIFLRAIVGAQWHQHMNWNGEFVWLEFLSSSACFYYECLLSFPSTLFLFFAQRTTAFVHSPHFPFTLYRCNIFGLGASVLDSTKEIRIYNSAAAATLTDRLCVVVAVVGWEGRQAQGGT